MVSIDVLPDDVLLDIFNIYCVDQNRSQDRPLQFIYLEMKEEIESWQTLVHVCRRWRTVAFGSPLYLNLELVCTAQTPARDTLDVWPPLPLVIWSPDDSRANCDFLTESVGNIIAVLERRDRVCQIHLDAIPASRMKELLAAVQEPFPELTYLLLRSYGGPIIPDSFLGGSAPRLEALCLKGISFPGLPKLLLSATRLVDLRLQNIPHSGYISPEVMATMLSSLTCLGGLILEFGSPQSRPGHESRPPLTHFVLPVLTNFNFKGVSYYLEYFVARIDAPQLNRLYINIVNYIVFDTPQFVQFVNRTPKLKALEKGQVIFGDNATRVKLSPVSSLTSYREGLGVKLPCRGRLDREVWLLEHVFTLSLPPHPALEDLYIYRDLNSQTDFQDDNIKNAIWLELLHLFPAVKNVYLCGEFAPRIMPALQELVGSRATEVLPNLQNILLEKLQSSGFVQEGIQEFIAARQGTSHPIGISPWDNSKQDKVFDGW